MLHLPRPLPGELLGSALRRAVRDSGLPEGRFLAAILGHRGTVPAVMTREPRIAQAFGMSLRKLLHGHTLLPYAVTFMEPNIRTAVLNALFDVGAGVGTSPAVAQSSTKFKSYLQFCPGCVHSDERRYGVAYWHREHQLPGVVLCLHHGEGLWVSGLRVNQPRRIVPPSETLAASELPSVLPRGVAEQITRFSYKALAGRVKSRSWVLHYRRRAADLGYGYDVRLLAGGVLAADLRDFYGCAFLDSVGLDFDPAAQTTTWPAALIRAGKYNVVPLRHLLLNVFLDNCVRASKPVSDLFARPQNKPFDWAAREREVLRKLEELKALCQAAGGRMSLAELSTQVSSPHYLWAQGVRNEMPAVSAWMKEFKASELSKRKTGGRPKKRKQQS
ncbi:TnsD family Tn7-like transposition protein [Castellaniella sp.]|uniref:TniQ family protein n=1 Tax=Castellaniella sp. TaxID=1955812 RepID=UPI003C76A85D